MSTEIKRIYSGQPAATNTTLWTCPTGYRDRIINATATNDTTSATGMTFHKVPSGEAVGDAYLIMNGKALASKATDLCPELVGQVLNAGDFINGIMADASQVSVAIDIARTLLSNTE